MPVRPALGAAYALLRRRLGRVALVWILAAVWSVATITLAASAAAYLSTLWTLAYRRFDNDPQTAVTGQPQPA